MRVAAAVQISTGEESRQIIEGLAASAIIDRVIVFGARIALNHGAEDKTQWLENSLLSGNGMNQLLSRLGDVDYVVLVQGRERVELGSRCLDRFVAVAEDSRAGIVYSDFRDAAAANIAENHPLLDYQTGSIRDTFDFGSMMLLSVDAIREALDERGEIGDGLQWGALYDLRLRLSTVSRFIRIPEPLYTRVPADLRLSGERQFDYVDPRQRAFQLEMESIATDYLKRIGAYLEPSFRSATAQQVAGDLEFGNSVKASVVIPVRNRERTIRDAVSSALSQKCGFDFNVIVVDNHSTDHTTEILTELAGSHARLIHMRPHRTDLGIGGCWNEALFSEWCGRYAVQLDSDDVYGGDRTLARIVNAFEEGDYGMVIGSYTIVNFDLEPIPPGLIDHREWTRENGRNNALRINGLGAPRAFYVPLLRELGGMPNTSYGEDYAVALRISRDYEIGRIYDSIYLARRWEGNSDAALPLATSNRYDAYKDYLRTVEILARQARNEA